LGQPSLPVIFDQARMQTLVNAAQTAANTFHSTAGVYAGTTCFLDQVSGATIGQGGKYAPVGQLTTLSPNTPTPGASTSTLPWNSASVLSLRTAIPRGRGSNGRVYWPCLSLAVSPGSGRVASAVLNGRVAAFKTFLDALNGLANTYFAGTRVIVASNVGAGVNAPVTSVRSDDRIDSIERRENDQAPLYVAATLA